MPVTMQAITQKLALQAKRALIDHWCFDKECPRDAGQRFSLSKTCRGQVGVELHQIWLKDLAKTCGKKCLYIVDLVCGSGEIAKACVDVKISEEASSQNVRVCSWSHDPRSYFHELAWARCGTHLGKLYLQNKLQMPGHNPVPTPGDVPRKTRKMVRALMGGPLRVLSLSGEGGLLFPDPVDVLRMCPEDEQGPIVAQFTKWKAKYPTISDIHDATETADGVSAKLAAGAGSANDALAAASAAIKAGDIVEGQEHVEKSLGETIVKQEKMPPMQAAIYNKLQMVLCAKPSGGHRIWLANTSKQQVVVPTGTYLGQAGPGTFVSIATTQLTEKQTPIAWRWTRITSHKRDNAELANAFLILVKDLTEPADGGKVKPKLLTLEDIEKEVGNNISLYGHSITRGGASKVTITPAPGPIAFVPNPNEDPSTFSYKLLGAWLPSLENTTGTTVKLDGLVRPVFEVTAVSPTAGGIAGSASSGPLVKPVNVSTRNCMHFFTCKKIDLPADGWIALG